MCIGIQVCTSGLAAWSAARPLRKEEDEGEDEGEDKGEGEGEDKGEEEGGPGVPRCCGDQRLPQTVLCHSIHAEASGKKSSLLAKNFCTKLLRPFLFE